MRIQLGKSNHAAQAPASAGLGLDGRRGWQDQILANVQYSSKYAFNQASTASALAEEELMELQRLVAGGPKPQEAQVAPERALPFMIDPMADEVATYMVEELPVAPVHAAEQNQAEEDYPSAPVAEECPTPLFRVANEHSTALFCGTEEHPVAPIQMQEERLDASFSQDGKTVMPELYNRPAQIGRTVRGTIEFVVQEDGRTLVPEYNMCGILTGVDFGDGTKLTQCNSDGSWHMMSHDSHNSQALPIKSVAFDKNGCLSIYAH